MERGRRHGRASGLRVDGLAGIGSSEAPSGRFRKGAKTAKPSGRFSSAHFCFREHAADIEDDAFTIIAADADDGVRRAVAYNPVDAYFVIGGRETHALNGRKGSKALLLEPEVVLLVEF